MPVTTTRTRPTSPAKTMRRQVAFLREFVKAPHVVAAITPSSPQLAKRMIAGLSFEKSKAIVEFGPGTGTFTKAVLKALPARWLTADGGPGRFIAIEYNKALSEILREQYPQVSIYNDNAANLLGILAAEGIPAGQVDAIVSGLGWPSFDDALRTQILEATFAALKPGGEFRTFGYHVGLLMRGAWHFRSEVRRLFNEVHISRVVWRNAPPAFVYRCVK